MVTNKTAVLVINVDSLDKPRMMDFPPVIVFFLAQRGEAHPSGALG